MAAVFWICGAPGAGKSVTAWALFEVLSADGIPVAYVDIDQLGMLYPASDDDPDRHVLKAEALVALVPGYSAAGARLVVVSGVVDPYVGPAQVLASDVDVTLCLLSADPAVLRERILARGWDEQDVDEAVAENAALREASFIDVTLEAADLSVAQTVNLLRQHVQIDERPTGASRTEQNSQVGLGVVVVTGPPALPSSAVGFALATRRWRRSLRTGFLNVQQVSFLAGREPAQVNHAYLAITQLATMHAVLSARGARLLVLGGPLGSAERGALRCALPEAPVTVVRLSADVATLRVLVRDRANGYEARLAGDDLRGANHAKQAAAVAAAVAEQTHLDAHVHDDHVLDVSGRTTAEVVMEIERLMTTQAE